MCECTVVAAKESDCSPFSLATSQEYIGKYLTLNSTDQELPSGFHYNKSIKGLNILSFIADLHICMIYIVSQP